MPSMAHYDPFSPSFEHPLELLYQLESAQEQLRRTRTEQQASTRLDFEVRERSLRDQLRQAKEVMDRNAFVMVLIDGDGTIFSKALLSRGEGGGKEAATRLALAASDLVAQRLPHLESPKLVLRIYADLVALSDLLVRSQIIDSPSTLDDFLRGFNSSKAFFDFVDAGNRPGAVADKACELLKLNFHEYGPVLQEVLRDGQVAHHLTLVESVPFDKGLDHLQSQFHCARFDSIFCKTRPSPLPAIALPKVVSTALPLLGKVESNKTTANSSASSTPAPNWATVTAAVPPPPPALKALASGLSPGAAAKQGSDTTIPNYEIQRVKKLKLCNLYYLQGKDMCSSSSCSHAHDYPISNSERRTLREVARMTPCYFRTECENPDCIYGHQCPQNKPNEPDCYFKEDCRYHGWGHGIDTRVVKTTKI
ncbi:hypothetical protein DV737_g546, partial [Chaetothyriales sp. CBS 132003]